MQSLHPEGSFPGMCGHSESLASLRSHSPRIASVSPAGSRVKGTLSTSTEDTCNLFIQKASTECVALLPLTPKLPEEHEEEGRCNILLKVIQELSPAFL